jgi:uncharacterized protein YndB with AHSA1/START domain
VKRFACSATSAAPPREVWKLLYDPARFTDWWEGMHTTELAADGFVFVQDDVPDLPIPHGLEVRRDESVVVVSCRLHDLVFEWRLARGPDGEGTLISVLAAAPDAEAAVLARQEPAIRTSVERLAALAAEAG